MIGRPAQRRGARVVGVLLACLLAAGVLSAGWRAASMVMGEGGHPLGPGSGPLRDELQPVTPGVGALILLAVAGIVIGRRLPRAGFVLTAVASAAYLVAGGLGWGPLPALAAVTLWLTRRHGVREAAGWLGALPVVYALAEWGRPALGLDDPRTWWALASLTLWTSFPSLFAVITQGRREAFARAHAEALRQAAADERLRVARDIHDVVGHSLSMISLQSGVALRVLQSDPAQARASLEAIRDSSKEAIAELRHTLGVFRADADLAPTPSLAGLPGLVADARAAGVRLSFTPVDVTGVPAAVQAVAFRVAQEGLTNAVRHAPGAPVTLALVREQGLLRVTVSDAGGPIGRLVEGGGLTGMRERVESLGGHLVVEPAASGMTLSAELPWQEP